MKNLFKLFGIIAFAAVIIFSFNTCSEPNVEEEKEIFTFLNRFTANPYTGSEKIKYSYTYDGLDFYYIYLGELKNTPLFFQSARYHSGIDWTYTFSTTNITQSSIREVVTASSQTVIGVVETHTESATTGGKLGTEINVKFKVNSFVNMGAKINGENSWANYTSDTTTNSFQETKSLLNTIEEVTSFTWSTLETDQFRLGRDDKIGFYRYTMFSASDVYLYVVRNSNTNEIHYEFIEHSIPDANFWQLDYSETPSFNKGDNTNFEFDISLLNNLPKPVLDLSNANFYTIEYNANGGSGEMGYTVHGFDQTQRLRQNTFTRTGYDFLGWARSSTAAVIEFADGQEVLNLTNEQKATIELYAVWQRIEEFYLENNKTYHIPSNTTRAIFRGNSNITYTEIEINVVQRSTPLIIEFHNVRAVGKNGRNGTNNSSSAKDGDHGKPLIYMGNNMDRIPDLTIISYGTSNELRGGSGGNGGSGNDYSRGGHGRNGGAAILAEKVNIIGNVNITITGGNGGRGGNGGNPVLAFDGTNGGNGGDGGAAVDANDITIDILGIIFTNGGARGNGGTRNNGLWGSGGNHGIDGKAGDAFTSIPYVVDGDILPAL